MRDIKLYIGKATINSHMFSGRPIDYCDQPVILTEDFNDNFSLNKSDPFAKFS